MFVYSLIEKGGPREAVIGKRVMYLDHNAFRGGGKRLGHVVAADWKWFGRKVKDHVSMRMCVRSRMIVE